MVPTVTRERLLYAVGILLGVAAIFYLGFRLLDDLSPATTPSLLGLAFLAFLIVGIRIERDSLAPVSYALAAGWYLAFVAYVLWTFDPGDGATFLLLAGSSALFIGLGYLATRGRLTLARRRARIGLAVVIVLGAGLLAVDAAGPQPIYTAEFEDSVAVPDRGERVQIGTVTVENEFALPRSADVPRYYACLTAAEPGIVPLQYDNRTPDQLIGGGEVVTHELVVGGQLFYHGEQRHEAIRDRETIPVTTAEECPRDGNDVRLVVVTDAVEPPDR